MKIVNFGSANIDFVYSLDHIVKTGETETTDKLEIFSGGKGLNQSIAISRAGTLVYHAGCIGNDGDMLKEILFNSGVDMSYVKNVDCKNGHAIIQVNSKGDNSIFLYPGSNEMISMEYIDKVLGDLEKNDIVLLQNEISNVKYIIEKSYEKGIRIVFNPSPYNDKIKDIDLNMISYIILNEIEAMDITGHTETEMCLDYFNENFSNLKVVLTLGNRGSVYSDLSERIYQPSYKVQAVDTTGAGDTFTGYFVSGIAQQKDYKEILKTASAAAAISVTKNGAAPSIPAIEEVENTINELVSNIDNRKNINLQNKIERYICENLNDATLEGLSNVLGYSCGYTGSIVKNITGKSFLKLIQEKRCSYAANKLLNSDDSVSEIIEQAGYSNETFFRKIFKETYGINPLEYRRKRGK